MDLANIVKKDTKEITLVLPNQTVIVNEDGTPMTITVHGIYSDKYRASSDEQQASRIKRAQSSGGRLNLTPEEIRQDRLDFVVSLVDTWNVTIDRQKPDCTPKNVRDLFKRLDFIFRLVDSELEEGQDFLEIRSKS